jgi:hypothetical protein
VSAALRHLLMVWAQQVAGVVGVFGRFLLKLVLAIGLALGGFHGSAARAAGQPNGAPKVTGSMYYGNNAQPPDLARDTNLAAGTDQNSPEVQTPPGDNKGGASDTAREGGGG